MTDLFHWGLWNSAKSIKKPSLRRVYPDRGLMKGFDKLEKGLKLMSPKDYVFTASSVFLKQ